MKQKKSPKSPKHDKDWQKKVEERLKVEKVKLNHPQGKERFEQITRRLSKKKR